MKWNRSQILTVKLFFILNKKPIFDVYVQTAPIQASRKNTFTNTTSQTTHTMNNRESLSRGMRKVEMNFTYLLHFLLLNEQWTYIFPSFPRVLPTQNNCQLTAVLHQLISSLSARFVFLVYDSIGANNFPPCIHSASAANKGIQTKTNWLTSLFLLFSLPARRRAAAKRKKLRNLGKSKSTDTEEDDPDDDCGEDGKLTLRLLFILV